MRGGWGLSLQDLARSDGAKSSGWSFQSSAQSIQYDGSAVSRQQRGKATCFVHLMPEVANSSFAVPVYLRARGGSVDIRVDFLEPLVQYFSHARHASLDILTDLGGLAREPVQHSELTL